MLSHSASLLLAWVNTENMTWRTLTSPSPGTTPSSWPSPQTTRAGMVKQPWTLSRPRWETPVGQICAASIGRHTLIRGLSEEEESRIYCDCILSFHFDTTNASRLSGLVSVRFVYFTSFGFII